MATLGSSTTRSGASLLTGPPPGRLVVLSGIARPTPPTPAGVVSRRCRPRCRHGRRDKVGVRAAAGSGPASLSGADGSPCAGSVATSGRARRDERSRPCCRMPVLRAAPGPRSAGAVPRSGWNEPRLRSMCSGACSRTIVCATCSGALDAGGERDEHHRREGERDADGRGLRQDDAEPAAGRRCRTSSTTTAPIDRPPPDDEAGDRARAPSGRATRCRAAASGRTSTRPRRTSARPRGPRGRPPRRR